MKTILLPDGVAESWFHVHCGGEVWFSRVCRGADLLKVLDEATGDAFDCYAERLADADNWYVNEGVCRSIDLACGEDPDIEINHIADPNFRMPRQAGGNVWHVLSGITRGEQLVELLAASCDDGIGIIARWKLRDDGTWDVSAMDTESADGMQPVTDFHEGECVTPEPPTA